MWSAPGRVNLIGEHTDYNDGFVLPFALPFRTSVAAQRQDDRCLTLSSSWASATITVGLDELSTADLPTWARYAAGVAWSLRADGHELGGAELAIDGDVPVGAGLSSSAALECAVATALDGLYDLGLDAAALARVAQRAETDFVGVPCGVMDQLAAMLCEAGHILLVDCRTLATRQIPLDLQRHGLALQWDRVGVQCRAEGSGGRLVGLQLPHSDT
ncbi:MAG: galactokinase [Acidimicrobiales bacterium]